jgi:hypothetical protein
MCELLAANSNYLQETLIQNDSVDAVIRDLIRLLVGIPKERGEKIYSLVGKFRMCMRIYTFINVYFYKCIQYGKRFVFSVFDKWNYGNAYARHIFINLTTMKITVLNLVSNA